MKFYVLYYDPILEMVGPFDDRQDAVEWALSRERKQLRPTLWFIKSTYSVMPSPYELTITEPENVI
jgi:hypothetical protein